MGILSALNALWGVMASRFAQDLTPPPAACDTFDDLDLDAELDRLLRGCDTTEDEVSPSPEALPPPSEAVASPILPRVSEDIACRGRFECAVGTKFGYIDIGSFLSRVVLWDITREQHGSLARAGTFPRDWLVEAQAVRQPDARGPIWCIRCDFVLEAVTHVEKLLELEPSVDRLLRALTFREDLAMKRLPLAEILVPTAGDRAYRSARERNVSIEYASELVRRRADKDRKYRERRKLKLAAYNEVLAPEPAPPTDKALYQREYYRHHKTEIAKRRRDAYQNNEEFRSKERERKAKFRVSL